MPHTFGHDETLPPSKIDNAIFEIDQETPVQNEKEFINVLMLVPVVFALHHRQPHDRVVHLAKRLVVPFVFAGVRQFLHIDQLQRSVQEVEVSLIREFFIARSRIHAANLTAEIAEVAEKNPSTLLCVLCGTKQTLLFAVEIIRFRTFNNDAICR